MRFIATIRKLLGNGRKIEKIFQDNDYLTAYRTHSNMSAKKDPQRAIGGNWEVIGPLQFDFLIKNGLMPENSLLDFGCGTLRAGRFFIRYLNEGNYTGIDISDQIIYEANRLIISENLTDKRPNIIFNADMDLAFNDIKDSTKFDFILAQSVFTHLFPEHITEIFNNLHKVMKRESIFFFTFVPNETFERYSNLDFSQPISFFEDLCNANGLKLERMEGYNHPKRQRMFKASFKNI